MKKKYEVREIKTLSRYQIVKANSEEEALEIADEKDEWEYDDNTEPEWEHSNVEKIIE